MKGNYDFVWKEILLQVDWEQYSQNKLLNKIRLHLKLNKCWQFCNIMKFSRIIDQMRVQKCRANHSTKKLILRFTLQIFPISNNSQISASEI